MGHPDPVHTVRMLSKLAVGEKLIWTRVVLVIFGVAAVVGLAARIILSGATSHTRPR
jgi:hypothetical protein